MAGDERQEQARQSMPRTLSASELRSLKVSMSECHNRSDRQQDVHLYSGKAFELSGL